MTTNHDDNQRRTRRNLASCETIAVADFIRANWLEEDGATLKGSYGEIAAAANARLGLSPPATVANVKGVAIDGLHCRPPRDANPTLGSLQRRVSALEDQVDALVLALDEPKETAHRLPPLDPATS